jgi:hypothetical protein
MDGPLFLLVFFPSLFYIMTVRLSEPYKFKWPALLQMMVWKGMWANSHCSWLSFSLIGERISQKAIAQLIGDPRYLRFNVLIREDAKVEPFTDVNVKVALSP